MAGGLFRVARREYPIAKLTVLDVKSGPSPATAWDIRRTLDLLWKGGDLIETEYVERDDMLHMLPGVAINTFRKAEVEGLKPVVRVCMTRTYRFAFTASASAPWISHGVKRSRRSLI